MERSKRLRILGFLKEHSSYAGTCKKNQEHKWNVNDPIFMQKNSDGSWLMCSNKDCFIAQGGTIEEQAKGKGGGRTMDMSLAFAKGFNDYAWKIATDHAKELFPDDLAKPDVASSLTKPQIAKERAIATESIFSTLMGAFNGK